MTRETPEPVTLSIHPEKIRDLIGPSGRTIRKLIEELGVTIDIEDDGTVSISSNDVQKQQKAVERIRVITQAA